jgi:hypothetical protein
MCCDACARALLQDDFVPAKRLSPKDMILIDMLNSRDTPDVCWVVTDPDVRAHNALSPTTYSAARALAA